MSITIAAALREAEAATTTSQKIVAFLKALPSKFEVLRDDNSTALYVVNLEPLVHTVQQEGERIGL